MCIVSISPLSIHDNHVVVIVIATVCRFTQHNIQNNTTTTTRKKSLLQSGWKGDEYLYLPPSLPIILHTLLLFFYSFLFTFYQEIVLQISMFFIFYTTVISIWFVYIKYILIEEKKKDTRHV